MDMISIPHVHTYSTVLICHINFKYNITYDSIKKDKTTKSGLANIRANLGQTIVPNVRNVTY